MKERSGMPYDVVAFETDEQALALTETEEGIFHRMLRKAWINGSIPADLNALAGLCRTRPSTMKKAWTRLSKLWSPVEGNPSRLENKKQESERIFLEKKRALASAAGKLSANSRKLKKIELTDVQQEINGRSTSLPSPPLPVPVPVPIHSPNTEHGSFPDSPSKSEGGVVEFEVFWKAYPRKVGKGDARKAWNRIRPTNGTCEQITAAIAKAKTCHDWTRERGRFIPHPATWLNGERWNDELIDKSTDQQQAIHELFGGTNGKQ